MRKDTISRLALKRVCYILFSTWTEWWLNIRRHIKLAPSPQTSEARKRKEQRRWKEEKRNLTACENRRKRACPVFHSLRGVPLAKDFEPDIFGILQLETVDCETLHLFTPKDRQGMLTRPLQGKLFRQGSPGDCLGLLHLRVNELTTVLKDSI